jgi:hypothetical protein
MSERRISRKPQIIDRCEVCPWVDYPPMDGIWKCDRLIKKVDPDIIDTECPLPIYSGTYPEDEL